MAAKAKVLVVHFVNDYGEAVCSGRISGRIVDREKSIHIGLKPHLRLANKHRAKFCANCLKKLAPKPAKKGGK
jgi:hypothetical protein